MKPTVTQKPSRLLLLAGVLMLISAWVPLLMVRFTSPQYPTESPTLNVYAGQITGDAHEFKVLSHYVGIDFPPDVPELDSGLVTWVFVGLGILALISSVFSPRFRRVSAGVLVLAILLLAAWGQFRFYQSGHNLDPEAPMRFAVKPFTPPLFGWVRVRNIVIYHLPHVGSVLMIGALTSLAFVFRKCRRAQQAG